MNFQKFLSCDYKDFPVYDIRGSFNSFTPEPPAEDPDKKEKPKGSDYVEDILKNHNIFRTTEEDSADNASTNLSHVDEVSGLSSSIGAQVGTDIKDKDFIEYYKRVSQIHSFKQDFNPHLEPIRRMKDEIIAIVDNNRVSLVTGRTGCGKTTQIPQLIFDNHREREIYCNIIVTQPRRIAAISVAKRVAQERNWVLGSIVGYKVSMNAEISNETRLTYCTAGILLQMLIKDKKKIPYTHIFVDEVHERNDETDFLLIVLKWILTTQKTNVKVVLMSATMDIKKFADYFSIPTETRFAGEKLPIVSVEDKTSFHVEVYNINKLKAHSNLQIPFIDFESPSITQETFIFGAEVIRRLPLKEESSRLPCKERELGAVLVFLPGFYEIETFFEILSKKASDALYGEQWSIFPLHSTTSFEEQIKVFEKAEKGFRKIILATNIAESSLTVTDVTYVVDFCLVKMAVQKEDTNYMSLETSWISKSQGAQRAGRVGRVSNGFVFRLVPDIVYERFEDDCPPEILRSPLDTLVLKAKQLNLGPPAVVLAHAMDPPKLDNIHRTILTLKEMGALQLTANGVYTEDDGDFTSIGALMAIMPFESHLSKLIIMGHLFSCLEDCIIMACAMAVKNVFSNPFKKQLEAYNSRLNWSFNSSSDPLSFLNVYKLYKEHSSAGRFQRKGAQNEHVWCQRQFVQLRSLREIECLEREMIKRLMNLNIRGKAKKDEPKWTEEEKPLILKFLLAGACYPNYFLCAHIIEEDAVKTLNGNNPYCTVYLKNFPVEQPKLLYQEVIRRKFLSCGSGINVSFDGSQKVYVHFENSATSASALDRDDKNGKILLAVYRACKMSQIRMPIEIPILRLDDALSKNREFYGDSNQLFLTDTNPVEEGNIGIRISVLRARLTEVVNPQCFWIHLVNEIHEKKLLHIADLMLNAEMMEAQSTPFQIGDLCASPFHGDDSFIYYRAKIVNIDRQSQPRILEVLYLDYGNTSFVKEDEVLAFTDAAFEIGLVSEPPLALKCSLAKIAPSISDNLVGIWTHKAKEAFYQFLPSDKECIVKIYSSVEGTMNVHLFRAKALMEQHCKDDTNEERSLNTYLIKHGLALPAEEPYLSRENNVLRVEAANRSDVASYSKVTNKTAGIMFDQKYLYENMDRVVQLKGPFSPLEVKLNGATKKSLSMNIRVDNHSVNSVLLDSYPMDTHDRIVVANAVSQGFISKSLTLRNTTVMPNIHGLYYLITMIFSPFVELKHDAYKSHYIGALCGLGYDTETKKSYYPENEIKLNFDTVIDNDDIITINKIRHYINYALKDDTNGRSAILNESKVHVAKKFLSKLISDLLKKRRESQEVGFVESSNLWGKGFDPKAIYKPHLDFEKEESDIFRLINIYKLEKKELTFNPTNYMINLQQMQEAVNLKETLPSPITCLFCKQGFDKLKNLKMHVHTNRHIEKVDKFNELLEMDLSTIQNKSIYQEFCTIDGEPYTDDASTIDDATSGTFPQVGSSDVGSSTVGDWPTTDRSMTSGNSVNFTETEDDASTVKDYTESNITEHLSLDMSDRNF